MASFPNERETHLTLEIERLVRGRILLIKETSITTIRTKMKRIQKTLPQVCCTVSISSLERVRHNKTVLMQDKSLPTTLFIQIQTTFPILITGGGSTLMGTFVHRKIKRKMEETLKRPPKAFSLSTKYTLLHYNSKK